MSRGRQKLWWGKYRGFALGEIPTGYLLYACGLPDLRPYLFRAILAELERRRLEPGPVAVARIALAAERLGAIPRAGGGRDPGRGPGRAGSPPTSP